MSRRSLITETILELNTPLDCFLGPFNIKHLWWGVVWGGGGGGGTDLEVLLFEYPREVAA